MLESSPPAKCADLLAAVLTPPPPARMAVLEAVEVGARLQIVLDLVKACFTVGEHVAPAQQPAILEDISVEVVRPPCMRIESFDTYGCALSSCLCLFESCVLKQQAQTAFLP